jgi:hypothetical protein
MMFTRTALRLECPNSFSGTRTRTVGVSLPWLAIHCVSVKLGTRVSESSKRVPIFLYLARASSKRVPILDRGTEAKPWRLGKAQTQLHVA